MCSYPIVASVRDFFILLPIICLLLSIYVDVSIGFLSSVFKLLLEDSVEIVHLFVSTLREKVGEGVGFTRLF